MDELKKVRRQGYAFDFRESEEGVECIAAPIRNHLGDTVAALSISGPQRKINTPSETHFVSQVVDVAGIEPKADFPKLMILEIVLLTSPLWKVTGMHFSPSFFPKHRLQPVDIHFGVSPFHR